MNIISSSSLFILMAIIAFSTPSCKGKENPVPENAFVTFTAGDVQISYPNTENRPLQLKEAVKTGAVIVTGNKSCATLQILKTGLVRISENTVLRADQILSPGKGTVLNLKTGKAFSKILKNKGTRYSVYTRTCVAAVRGTEFMVIASPKGRSRIMVRNGVVAVSAKSGTTEKDVTADTSALVDITGDIRLVQQNSVEKLELEKYSLQPYIENVDKAGIQEIEAGFKEIEPAEQEVQKKIEKLKLLRLSPLDRLRKKGLSLVKLYVKDGSQLMGAIEKITPNEVYLNTGESVITIPKNEIRRRENAK